MADEKTSKQRKKKVAPATSTSGVGLFGKKIREYRWKKGLTLVELAKKLGISHGTLSEIENEKTSPSHNTILALTTKTDINPVWLFADIGEMLQTPIAPILERLSKALGIKKREMLEAELGLKSGWLIGERFELPHDLVVALSNKRGISLDWIYSGYGEMFRWQRASIDLALLQKIIEIVEETQREGHHLTPKKKAKLITLLYNELIESPSKISHVKEVLIKFSKLAS